MEILPGISINPDVRFGKPCITGTRIVANQHQLSLEQVRTALAFAAHVAAHLPPAVRQAP